VKLASVLLAVGCSLSAVHAVWLEKTILIPDSFGVLQSRNVWRTTRPTTLSTSAAYNSDCVIAIDGATNQRIARIPTGKWVQNLCYNPTNNKVYCACWGNDSVNRDRRRDPTASSQPWRQEIGLGPSATTRRTTRSTARTMGATT